MKVAAGLVSLGAVFVCTACGPEQGAAIGKFEDHFVHVRSVVLEEPDSAPITGIQSLAPGMDGGVVMVDKGRSQVRLHAGDGTLTRILGRYGAGPGEFKWAMDARFDSMGRLFVADGTTNRITRFHPDLRYDTAFTGPGMAMYAMDWVPDGMLVTTWNEPRGDTPYYQAIIDTANGATRALLGPIDSVLYKVPYWSTNNAPIAGAGGTVIVTGNYLLYPFSLYDSQGRLVRTFGTPPPSYRPPTELERGEFLGPEGMQRMREWLRSHTRVSRLEVYHDTLIFAVHADPEPTVNDRAAHVDRTMDVYDATGTKLWSDIPLPGVRVLRVEDYVYILETMPPDGPWTIGKYEYRGARQARDARRLDAAGRGERRAYPAPRRR